MIRPQDGTYFIRMHSFVPDFSVFWENVHKINMVPQFFFDFSF